jgi:hypothetical protein
VAAAAEEEEEVEEVEDAASDEDEYPICPSEQQLSRPCLDHLCV